MRMRRIIGLMLGLSVLAGVAAAAEAADTPDPAQTAIDQTPPRLSFTDGQVSFWRPGAQDWAQAQVNTPLAPGDELFTASPGNLELQIGARAFVRGWANTQIGLVNQEPDFIQFKVTTGFAAFDLRALEPGHTVEVDTPNAAFTIEHPGYYRVDVTGERTSFITRRAGRATVTPASGQAVIITPSEEVVIEGTSSPQVASYAAPQLDAWDKWNYARTDGYLDAVSARHVSPGTYGASDLDRYGTWRAVPTYGSVWVPTAVQAGWVPYSTGSWTQDPSYGWTWVDAAPWGWAPYHYGRWVFVDGFWAWAPGPVVARPVYAPALVAFFGGPSVRVGISIGGPLVGWVALGWGEPVVPWWGREGFVHVPSWRGWGGPRVVNNTVINTTTVVNVQNINVYGNSNVQNAVVVVNENRFGRGPITSARVTQADVKGLQLIHTAPQIAATPASFVPTATRGIRPPEDSLKRSVVATRPPHVGSEAAAGAERKVGPAGIPTPPPRLVSAPQRHETVPVPARPAFGQSTVERPTTDRAQPPSPPGAPTTRQAPPQPRRAPEVASPPPTAPKPPAGQATPPPGPARRAEPPQVGAPSPIAPQPPAGRPTAPPAQVRRAEPPQVGAPTPIAPKLPAGQATPPPGPARRAGPPQVGAPSPTPPTTSCPPGTTPVLIQTFPPQTKCITPGPTAPQPPAGQATPPPGPARRAEPPQVGAQAPAAPQPPAGRAVAPPAQVRRAEAPKVTAPAPGRKAVAPPQPAQPLPGEPANRISPNRAETQQPREERR